MTKNLNGSIIKMTILFFIKDGVLGMGDIYDEDEYEDVYDEYTDIYDGYDEVYDEDGYEVLCDMCTGEIKWKDGVYVCPKCGQIMSREVFFNYIGADPPGEECVHCDNLYPGCVICPYGYCDDIL